MMNSIGTLDILYIYTYSKKQVIANVLRIDTSIFV